MTTLTESESYTLFWDKNRMACDGVGSAQKLGANLILRFAIML